MRGRAPFLTMRKCSMVWLLLFCSTHRARFRWHVCLSIASTITKQMRTNFSLNIHKTNFVRLLQSLWALRMCECYCHVVNVTNEQRNVSWADVQQKPTFRFFVMLFLLDCVTSIAVVEKEMETQSSYNVWSIISIVKKIPQIDYPDIFFFITNGTIVSEFSCGLL